VIGYRGQLMTGTRGTAQHGAPWSAPDQGGWIEAPQPSQQGPPHIGSSGVIQARENIVLGPVFDQIDVALRRELMLQPIDLGAHVAEPGATELRGGRSVCGVGPRPCATDRHLNVELVERAGDNVVGLGRPLRRGAA
jgi:hypothetical protein